MIIRDLSFGYRKGRAILEGVNLTLPMDSNILLQGANGSGKSTLCRVLAGLEPSYTGSILLDGRELRSLDPAIRSEHLLYLKQETDFNLLATTADEDMGIWQNRFHMDDTPEKANEREIALRELDIATLAKEPLWELSGGQKKRVGLSAVTLMRKQFWILDEPDAGLDESGMQSLLQLLERRREAGLGSLIVSHRIEKIQQVVDIRLMIQDRRCCSL